MIGVDEVGRGCYAGPMLVVAARVRKIYTIGLKDSKKLTREEREDLFGDIVSKFDLGEGWVQHHEIDALGLTKATRLGVQRALDGIKARTDEEIIIDGHINYANSRVYRNSVCMIKADDKCKEVSAASIYAKVTRDRYMMNLAAKYPQYGFETNVGYGTLHHRKAMEIHGLTDIHRRLFAPVKQMEIL
ncbi:MAG: ribonuclease HII [bacterium]|nr:ribonuclease HII [bacterium]